MLPRFVVPALAAAAFQSATPASAGSLQSAPGNGTYMIKVLKSGKCLDVVGSSTQDGTPIQQFTCNPSKASQRFTLTMRGSYKVQSGEVYPLFSLKTFSGQCMSMRLVGSHGLWLGIGNYVVQRTCLPDSAGFDRLSQRFYFCKYQHPWEGMVIEPAPDDGVEHYFTLQIQNASMDDGAGPILDAINMPGNGGKNDSFIFIPVGS